MIKFSDNVRKSESFNAPAFQIGFDEIKPRSSITKTEAFDFWNLQFSESKDVDLNPEEDIRREVYGRSESEFGFDIDISNPGITTVLDQFHNGLWNDFSVEEKENISVDLMLGIARTLGINDAPTMDFYDADEYDYGAFDPDCNRISINRKNFSDPDEIVDTIAHETFHAYQFERAKKPENEMDFLYAYNFEHYISPYMDEDGYIGFIDYQDQLIEAEARAFAKLFREEGEKNA